MKALGLGVVGSGVIAIQAIFEHLQLGDMADRVYLEAVCDPVPGRAQAAAEKYGIKKFFQSLDEMLEDPDVGIVSLCSPISLHYSQGLQAIRAGKSVHFNKTMALTTAEATELIEEAAKRNVKLVASPGMMLWPTNRKIRKAILGHELGKITWAMAGVEGVMFYHLNEETRKAGGIVPAWYYKQPSGGPQYDSTAYALHSMTGVLGPAKRVSCFSGQIMKNFQFGEQTIESEVDDNIMMMLDFGNSVFGIIYSALKGEPFNGFTPAVYGTEGSALNGKIKDAPMFAQPHEMFLFPNITPEHLKLAQPHVFADVMQLVDAVREDKPTVVSAEHARHVIEIIEAGWESARTGRAVDLTTTFQTTSLEELA